MNVFKEENYPDVVNSEDGPWSETGASIDLALIPVDDVMSLFLRGMSENPQDVPTRFTALKVLHFMSHVMIPESDTRAARENLKSLVCLPKLEEYDEWKRIRWEILNAYAVSDFELARSLYDHAEKLRLLPESTLWTLRGQFSFLRAYSSSIANLVNRLTDPEAEDLDKSSSLLGLLAEGLEESYPSLRLESCAWQPELVRDKPTLMDLLLFAFCSYPEEAGVDRAEIIIHLETYESKPRTDFNWIGDSLNDLAKALRKGAQLSPLYSLMAARCNFDLENFDAAARSYLAVIKSRASLQSQGTGFSRSQSGSSLLRSDGRLRQSS